MDNEFRDLPIRIFSILNHEVRTPINIILNSTNLIKQKIDDKEYITKRLEGINNNSYRLIKLMNNLLDIVEIDTDKLELIKEEYNIVQVVEEVFRSSTKFANKKNIEITFSCDEEEIITQIDKNRIQRIILNLISNSIKFTASGGYIRGKLENNNIVIKIEDTGIGIESHKVENIFEKFEQLAKTLTREAEGGGLGLYFVKKVIDMHNGTIEFDSKINKGTKVIITLPILIENEVNTGMSSNMITIDKLVKIEMSDLINL